jgi:hypothetical protein
MEAPLNRGLRACCTRATGYGGYIPALRCVNPNPLPLVPSIRALMATKRFRGSADGIQ